MKDGVSYTDSTEVNVAPIPKVWTSFADNFSEDEFYYVGDITALPSEPDKLYTGSEYSNGDVMFVDYTTGAVVARLPDGEAIAPNPSNSTDLVALTSPITGNGEIVESFDAGLNWATAAIQDDLPLLNGHHLQYTPDGAVLLLHSDSSGSRVSAGEVGIARSVDGGRNWSAPTGLATFSGVGLIATSASEPSKIFAISGAEHILRSLDYGASWKSLNSYPNAGLPSTVSWDFDGYSVGNMACAASNDASGTIIYLSLNDGRGAYRYIDSGI